MDIETTGLTPDIHDIIDICLVETNRKGVEIKRHSTKIKPNHNWKQFAEARAMEVNHYTEEGWTEASDIHEVENKIIQVFGSAANKGEILIPAGWNIPFDIMFVKEKFNLWDDESRKRVKLHHHPLDLMGLGWNYIKDQAKANLEMLCDRLGVKIENAHTAEGDVNACIECYKRLLY